MLSRNEILDGLNCVEIPQNAYFNVWHEGEMDGEAAWMWPLYYDGFLGAVSIPAKDIAQLSSSAEVAARVTVAVAQMVEKLSFQLAAERSVSRN